MSPNKEHIRLWVDALRSGKYHQTRKRLKEGLNAFCCLGVACEISKIAEWNEETYIDSYEVMPELVVNWLGIGSSNPVLEERDGNRYTAIDLNDEEGKDFLEIADLIERKYLK